ncbi:hypothetical protein [Sphingomonas sp. C3-2]|uniref:hypothetical protein n=1 Tax=Sphingomonas sp. C3-2 TaxID=3062169 RepID=UPI00294B2195|nr:hypothetical protein [Sphingomonas sp. C3-2]WOK38021.1 hypothetical protein QYC26_07525 [Sphingomonas sp. C3-2]
MHLADPPIRRAIEPALSGYRIMYHRAEPNRCPGCGNSNWHIGRISAQCAFCDLSLPLAEAAAPGDLMARLGL